MSHILLRAQTDTLETLQAKMEFCAQRVLWHACGTPYEADTVGNVIYKLHRIVPIRDNDARYIPLLDAAEDYITYWKALNEP